MKVLFLDFDGVLTYIGDRDQVWDRFCLYRLMDVVVRTGTNVVVSSSWRHDHSLFKLGKFLDLPVMNIDENPTCSLIGVTPGAGAIFTHDSQGRGTNIAQWLADHGRDVDRWAVVDDDVFDMQPWMLPRIVQTSSANGLTEEAAEELVALLGER